MNKEFVAQTSPSATGRIAEDVSSLNVLYLSLEANLHVASSFGRVLSQLFSAKICSRSGRSPSSPGSLGDKESSKE